MKQPQLKKHNIFKCALSYSLVVVGFVLLFASCKTPRNLTYMQGAFDVQQSATMHSIRLMADDKVSIFVKSRDEVLTQHFNISLPNMQQVLTYTLDDQGNIDFPMLGKVALLGLTRAEAAQRIKNRLVQEFGAKDVVVTVDFSKLTFSVLGEVNKAGNFDITKDRITIFDALGMAGDMTIYGQRDSVKVFREVDGKPVVYMLNWLQLLKFCSRQPIICNRTTWFMCPLIVHASGKLPSMAIHFSPLPFGFRLPHCSPRLQF